MQNGTHQKIEKVVVIGAGIGGLTTAALLAKAGLDVTVLEAHIYPGGCAGTFFHKGYQFDAGATLAGGFYPGGPMDIVAKAIGIKAWPARPSDPAMTIHLPSGSTVDRWGSERRWETRRAAFGPEAEPFWRWQERTADALWDLALRMPPWPPQSGREALSLVQHGLGWLGSNPHAHLHPTLLQDFLRPVSAHLHNMPEDLRLFIDAQLLIASQAISNNTNALYGASALDLPRRGVVHLKGGIGAIAETIAEAVQQQGGSIRYRQQVETIIVHNGRAAGVTTKRGEHIEADVVIANLPPWNIARLLGDNAPRKLRNLPGRPKQGGGAFMVYAGIDESVIPTSTLSRHSSVPYHEEQRGDRTVMEDNHNKFPLHHQLILREPMGEGNTIFMSISPGWDADRAPAGQRCLTISTHTQLDPWWDLFEEDRDAYERKKQEFAQQMLASAERVLPGLRDAASLVKPGTPVTFQRFTRRDWGWVGGFPQSDLFRAWAPKLGPSLWMVGDTIFPGQSTAAVALGGIRVANSVLAKAGISASVRQSTVQEAEEYSTI